MKRIVFLIPILAFFSCAPKEASAPDGSYETVESQQDPSLSLTSVPSPDIYSDGKTKLIKTVDYRFEVDNVKKSTEAIEASVKKYPAYISSSNLLLENPILENKITIRVQSEYFHELLKEIDQQARFVNFRNVKTNDVAKEFVDLESRLKTKREVEERYIEILRKKAGTIEELLKAEEQIGALHEEIEATVSRMQYLRDQVSYSTINLEFYQTITQEIKAGGEITIADRFGDALGTGWDGLVSIFIGLAYIWPIFLFAVIIIGLIFWRKRYLLYKHVNANS